MAGPFNNEEWYLKDLLAFMLGIDGQEIGDLVNSYLDQGGKRETGSLFHFLSSQGRQYRVLWALFSFSEQISLAAATVFGPGARSLWTGVAALPYGASGATLSSWRRLLPLIGGVALPSQPKVSESDFWTARQMERPLRSLWPDQMKDLLREIEEHREAGAPSFEGGRDFIRELTFDMERPLRESTGKSLACQAVFMDEVALPELRETAGGIPSLQLALDSFVAETVGLKEGEKERRPDLESPSRPGLQDYPLRVDPVLGVPLSELRPGTPVLLEAGGGLAIVGEVYMVRLLKDGQIEVHGSLPEEGTFFRSVAPGNIKIAVSKERFMPPLLQRTLLPLVGGLLLVVLLLLLLFY